MDLSQPPPPPLPFPFFVRIPFRHGPHLAARLPEPTASATNPLGCSKPTHGNTAPTTKRRASLIHRRDSAKTSFFQMHELLCQPQVCFEAPRADACRLCGVVRTSNEFQASRTRLYPSPFADAMSSSKPHKKEKHKTTQRCTSSPPHAPPGPMLSQIYAVVAQNPPKEARKTTTRVLNSEVVQFHSRKARRVFKKTQLTYRRFRA